MKPAPGISNRRLFVLTMILYLVVWLAEAASKLLAVLGEYTGDDLKSTLAVRLNEGLRVLAPSILVYVLTLILIYVMFAFLNGHYASLMSGWIGRRWPKAFRAAPAIAFFAVNGIFLTGVYVLNTALYPSSSLSYLKGPARILGGAPVLKSVGLGLLGFYLLGCVVLNIRYAKGPMKAVSLLLWAILLVAPFDPVYLIQRALPRSGSTGKSVPNVIMIGLDSLNPLHTGYAGYPLPLTPNLDSFLRENVVFRNCFTPIARTFPSWYSILTGQYPVTNGVRLNLQKRKYINSAGRCIGHVLKERGFTTVHFTDEVRFSNITPEDGFDILRHPKMGVKDFVFGSFHDFSLTNVFFNNPMGGRIFPFLRFNRAVSHLYNGRYFVNELVTTLDRLQGRGSPFFLAVDLCIGHWPYFHASPREFEHRAGAEPRMALYDSAISVADYQLGRILADLKASGLYENSLIVILSDHGESAEGHGSDLRDPEQNRTLLAWKPVGPATHREIGRLVRTIDIAPTILDLLGWETGGHAFDGVSLRPWIQATAEPEMADAESVFMETEFSLDTPGGIGLALQSMIEQGVKFYEFDRRGLITVRDDYYDILVRRRNRAIMTPDWKLVRDVIVRGDRERVQTALFDLRKDPGCKRDVSSDEPILFRQLWERLRRYYGPEID
jgi:arylsulfatase A-like enzyme